MSCYNPLVGVYKGLDSNGKKIIKILPGKVDGVYKTLFDKSVVEIGNERVLYKIPCGHCLGCRSDLSKEWSDRLIMESLYHEHAYFITLTYCNEYLCYKMRPSFDPETGEYCDRASLDKSDWQAFMKRLRAKFPERRLRFYCAGEYGDNTQRPHYHAIIFGLPDKEDLHMVASGASETGNIYYCSDVIEDCWKATEDSIYPLQCNKQAVKEFKDPSLLGWCSIEPANQFTMKYVTSYVTKKIGKLQNSWYDELNIVPPFSLSSRKPGIGLQYFEDHPECIVEGQIKIASPQGTINCRVPRYFKKKFKEIDPERYDEMALEKMRAADRALAAELSLTDLDEYDYLIVKENSHKERMRSRNKI